jgi:multiple sugar transport system permease protein
MNVLIFMGAVLNMPGDVIEAARIDGAKRFTLFFKIKLPLLMPTVMMVAIVTIIGSMRVFDTIKLMTDGGPEGSTMVMVYYIYHQAFRMFNTGSASALAVVLFLIVLVLTALQWFSRKRISFYES